MEKCKFAVCLSSLWRRLTLTGVAGFFPSLLGLEERGRLTQIPNHTHKFAAFQSYDQLLSL